MYKFKGQLPLLLQGALLVTMLKIIVPDELKKIYAFGRLLWNKKYVSDIQN